MKKVLAIVIIITLPIIGFFQYKKYRRFNPPANYEYAISDSIDVDYYDQALVDEYYTKAIEIGAFARLNWRNDGIDVRYPDNNSQVEKNAAIYWNQLNARVNKIERKLQNSFLLKKEGFNNSEIKLIESGSSKEELKYVDAKDGIIQISFGEQSKYVWWVQSKLIEKGYDHQLDGLFGIDTQNAILAFQRDLSLYPSGTVDEETFKKLFFE